MLKLGNGIQLIRKFNFQGYNKTQNLVIKKVVQECNTFTVVEVYKGYRISVNKPYIIDKVTGMLSC